MTRKPFYYDVLIRKLISNPKFWDLKQLQRRGFLSRYRGSYRLSFVLNDVDRLSPPKGKLECEYQKQHGICVYAVLKKRMRVLKQRLGPVYFY